MSTIGLRSLFSKRFSASATEGTIYQLMQQSGAGFYSWNGKVYESDIVRACMRPKVKAIGKMVPKHIRYTVNEKGESDLAVNPDPYMRFLLEEPNPHMTFQVFAEKMEAQLILNSNAFALIVRDENGFPTMLLPIVAFTAQAKMVNGVLYLEFGLQNGKKLTAAYCDIIHLRADFCQDDIFGDPLAPALTPLMEVVSITDQSVVKAIKNSGIIQWLLKFKTSIRPEELKKQASDFATNYLNIANDSIGVAATDATKTEAERIEPKDYVPNAALQDRTRNRIQALLNTNEKIVTSAYGEDDWTAYFEAEVEPDGKRWSEELTRKLFSRRARGFGNVIFLEASNLQYASMSTKLSLFQLVDRRSMTPNEWRATMNLAPKPGGDELLQRKDTGTVGK